ncbi:hypothetical protein DKG77_15275 [Flagellimonas aquimarina]|uniref:Host attachment protein n=1 Tax=Flagellimonas aquimarina TaxID=2201895 RepID=A0A316KX28_9FLAO|nr:hypothetical protein [Allomuricauda koreensis]PWL37658.1 hypothetical protein DKG77_15275 [Allomuricauda koreensis]
MKQVGIWLDKQKADYVLFENGEEKFFTIPSNMEFFNPKGGSRSKTRWGPQDVVQDSKYLEREKHQLKRYFENLATSVKNADQLAIFGPAETADRFMGYLEKDHQTLAVKVKVVDKADSMTENQFKALARSAFDI